jgi:hypothetical protein
MTPMKKWPNEMNRDFSKEEVQMAKKHMKKCSPFLTINEMQIKTTLRFHLLPVRIAIIKNINNKCWRGCGKKEPPYTAGRNANYYNYGKQYGAPQKPKNRTAI